MTRATRLLGTLRARLVLGYALVVALLAGLWAWSLYGPLTQAGVEQQRRDLVTVARVAALSATDTPPQQAADRISRSAGTHVRVTIVAADGVVLADSAEDASTMENHATRPEVAAALRGHTGSDTRRSATVGTEQMYVALPATVQGRRVALRVSEPLAIVQGQADAARTSGLWLLIAALAAAVVAVVRLSGSMAAPVLRLKEAAEAMAAGDLDVAVPAQVGELGELSTALDDLRGTIRTALHETRDSEAMLRQALDGLPEAVFLLQGERVAYRNRAASAMFRTVGPAHPELDGSGLPASLTGAAGELLGAEQTAVRELGPDPEGRYFRLSVVPVGSPGLVLLLIADTTRSGRFDAMRRDFVANASHELKTPVAAIRLLAEAGTAAIDDGDAEQAKEFIGQITHSADHLKRLVADLLDLARLEHSHRAGAVTDMRAAVQNAYAAHRPAATAAGLDLALDMSRVPGQDVYAAADATDMAVALDNLLSNAIAYTEHGRVELALDAEDDAVIVSVTDTGLGIAPEHLPRVFERFYRVDAARSRATGGTGLGLALVRNAVEVSGGTVEVASEVSRGTTFTVRLPRAR